MRTLICFTLLFTFFSLLPAQTTVTDIEMQSISDDLVEVLKGKGFDGKLIVFNFTNQAGQVSELGGFLADILRSELVNAPARFEVVLRDLETGKSNRSGNSWGKDLLRQVATQEYNERTGNTNGHQVTGTALEAVDAWTNPSPNSRMLKGIDAIVEGTITTLGDQYYLTITTKRKKGDTVLATARGQITNTPVLSRLQGSILPEPTIATATTVPGTINPVNSNSQGKTFNRLHLNFEMIRCTVNGSYLECHLRAYSSGKDSNLNLCHHNVHIFNQNGGTEHKAVNLAVADANGKCWVGKALIRDTPIDMVFSFTPGEDVDVISKLQFNVRSEGIADFVVEFRDIFVQ